MELQISCSCGTHILPYYVSNIFWAVEVVLSNQHFTLLNSIVHDPKAFTQGLQYYNGVLYESTGMYGDSEVRIVHPDTGEVLLKNALGKAYFGEGLVVHSDKIYILTWKEKVMLVHDSHTLQFLYQMPFRTHTGEGWGLATDGSRLFASDGSNIITIWKMPTSQNILEKIGELSVTDNNRPLHRINELEYIDGYLYADVIVVININSGVVVHKYDFRMLFPAAKRPPSADCFNGIAYNNSDRTVMLTGKYWPHMYRVNIKLPKTSS